MPRSADSACHSVEHLVEREVVEMLVVDAGVVGVVEALGLPGDGDAEVVATELAERRGRPW